MIIPTQATKTVKGHSVIIERRCQVTGKEYKVKISVAEHDRWRLGESILEVLPHLTADEREILITGYTPDEWDTIFKDE